MAIRHYRLPVAQVDEVVRRVDDIWLERAREDVEFLEMWRGDVVAHGGA